MQGNPVLQGTHNAARRIVDGLTYVSDTVTDYSKKPTKVVTNWVTDRIAPPYWIPNAQITVCNSCILSLWHVFFIIIARVSLISDNLNSDACMRILLCVRFCHYGTVP